uniref:Uncharacterized protein n=1 Tax=Anguilla anguilla TaxID=7936 RepID=A0A0E9X5B2_ANGAN
MNFKTELSSYKSFTQCQIEIVMRAKLVFPFKSYRNLYSVDVRVTVRHSSMGHMLNGQTLGLSGLLGRQQRNLVSVKCYDTSMRGAP